MKYDRVIPAVFVARPNRFIAHVEVDGVLEIAHVKNTGRCRELLIPGCRVYLSCPTGRARKTKYDLIAVEKEREGRKPLLINMDSQIPNDVAKEWLCKGKLFSDRVILRREVTYGSSRFDFYIEDGGRKAFLEVKGVTLEKDGIARFPDAPTERGIKHLNELCHCREQGFEAYVLFVIQMKEIVQFRSNDETHKAFGDALREAASKGVKILAVDCIVRSDSIEIDGSVPIQL